MSIVTLIPYSLKDNEYLNAASIPVIELDILISVSGGTIPHNQ